MNVLVVGALGKMGTLLRQALRETLGVCQVYGYDQKDIPSEQVYHQLSDVPKVDLVIDFSVANLIEEILTFSVKRNLPLVIAATGHSDVQKEMILKASETIPIFMSANYAYGIAALKTILETAVHALGASYDIEILERHHAQKIDAPSGTALDLAKTINETLDEPRSLTLGHDHLRDKESIGIHAVRAGSIVGEHTVLFAGKDEVIEIKHTAQSKMIFVHGAIKAALWLLDKPKGFYQMSDMIKGVSYE